MITDKPLLSGKTLTMKAGLVVVLILVTGSVYILTLSHTSSYDALSYYRDVEYGAWKDLGHPHHLIYLPMLRVWYDLWKGLGYNGNVVLPSRILSLAAALGIAAAFARLLAYFFRPGKAFVLALVLGFTYTTWHFASEVEPVDFFILFSILNTLLLLRIQTRATIFSRDIVLVACVNSLGVMFHQSLAVFIPISAVYLGLNSKRGARVHAVTAYTILAALLIAIPYLAAGRYWGGARNLSASLRWASTYKQHFREFGLGSWSRVSLDPILHGIGRTFLGGTALKPYVLAAKPKDVWFYLAASPYAITAALVTLGLAICVAGARSLCRRHGWTLLTVFMLVPIFGCIASWWEPWNRTFWGPTLPSLVIFTGLGYSLLPDRPALKTLGRGAPILLLATLIAGNLAGGIMQKHAQEDTNCPVVTGMRSLECSGSIVILRNGMPARLLAYYCPSLDIRYVTCPRGCSHRELITAMEPALRGAGPVLASGRTVFFASDLIASPEDIIAAFSQVAGIEVIVTPCFTCAHPVSGHPPFTMYEVRRYADTAAR
jgi:hypothetical protein